MVTAYERILDKLEGVRRTGNKAIARCPAHEDRNPSLSVKGIEGMVLLHCFAGCTEDDILAELKLAKTDRFDNQRGATYSYIDGAKVRRTYDIHGKKKFWQDNPTNGAMTALFRVDKVKTAVAVNDPVCMVEGEKDVLAIESLGGVATTNRGGAASLERADLTPLHGARVNAIVDDDEAGRKWAEQLSAMLDGKARSLQFFKAKVGKDAADHIAADLGLRDFVRWSLDDDEESARKVVLTSAANIRPRRVKWLWKDRLAIGSLSLLAGREGLGKSTVAYWLAGQITRGILPGEYVKQSRAVLVCATEDSWEHTIVPRLMAANADLNKIYRVEVVSDEVHVGLSLPRDIAAVKNVADEVGAAMLLLDPLMSRLDSKIDTHKDAEVRRALEPLAALADQADLAVLGLIHHNKGGSNDPLSMVMGSRAFTAVARSVHTVVPDPDDENDTRKLFGTPKNNLGRTDLETLGFTIVSHAVETDEGTNWTGRLEWGHAGMTSIAEAMRQSAERSDQGATAEAQYWLEDYLTSKGGTETSQHVKTAGQRAGHSLSALDRARQKLKLDVEQRGFPRMTWWSLPGSQP